MKKYFEEYVMRNYMRPIDGFPGYAITADGEVLTSLRAEEYSPLKQWVRDDGRASVRLSRDGVKTSAKVHRLVANAFIANPENKKTVNHKDGDPLNNAIENLEWNTSSENHIHAYRVLGRKLGHARPVIRCADDKQYRSICEAARENSVNRHVIYKALTADNQSHWRYA